MTTSKKGIKRHPCLRPLSRDHLIALMGAQRLMKASKAEIELEVGLSFFETVWTNEISQHLLDEERILPEFIKSEEDREKLFADHEKLREFQKRLAQRDEILEESQKELAGEAGQFLDDHVRWEERYLFPSIENSNSGEEIERLLALTEAVEKQRQRSKACEPRKRTKKYKRPQ